jgi:hypothetical protein
MKFSHESCVGRFRSNAKSEGRAERASSSRFVLLLGMQIWFGVRATGLQLCLRWQALQFRCACHLAAGIGSCGNLMRGVLFIGRGVAGSPNARGLQFYRAYQAMVALDVHSADLVQHQLANENGGAVVMH